jgi:DNA repair protein RecN (Recombination protein N)
MELNRLEKAIYENCVLLSEKRKSGAKIFSENVKAELKELGMKNADFFIEFNEFDNTSIKKAGENGLDSISFMFSANLGEPPKTLSKVISGGEMSRFMLALKTQTLKFNDITTFIFDEIDSGISGIIARTVAEKFAKITLRTQIIAISHLPQIAAMSDNQLYIEKTEAKDKTTTSVKKLNENQKISELIRLLGGSEESDAVKSHAKDLITSSNTYKNNLLQCI